MREPTKTSRAGAAFAGLLAGGAGGFVLTEGAAAFFHFVLDMTADPESDPALLLFFLGVPLLTAVAGAVLGPRIATREAARDRARDRLEGGGRS